MIWLNHNKQRLPFILVAAPTSFLNMSSTNIPLRRKNSESNAKKWLSNKAVHSFLYICGVRLFSGTSSQKLANISLGWFPYEILPWYDK